MPLLCVCYSCGCTIDCDPSGICELCEGENTMSYGASSYPLEPPPSQPGDRQTLNILQRLHRSILQVDNPYVSYTKDCRWVFNEGVYTCNHVSIKQEDVVDSYKRQMEK